MGMRCWLMWRLRIPMAGGPTPRTLCMLYQSTEGSLQSILVQVDTADEECIAFVSTHFLHAYKLGTPGYNPELNSYVFIIFYSLANS
jgi:hypothetical protein